MLRLHAGGLAGWPRLHGVALPASRRRVCACH